MSHTIYFNFVINTSKQKVYEAISKPEHLENWWPLKCKGIPAIGEVYNFNFTDTYDWYAQVKDCDAPNRIHYKMTKSDKDWDPTSFGFEVMYVYFFWRHFKGAKHAFIRSSIIVTSSHDLDVITPHPPSRFIHCVTRLRQG